MGLSILIFTSLSAREFANEERVGEGPAGYGEVVARGSQLITYSKCSALGCGAPVIDVPEGPSPVNAPVVTGTGKEVGNTISVLDGVGNVDVRRP